MTKLTDTQLLILSAAAQRDDRTALPLPDRLKGGAANKVVLPLIEKGLLEEVEASLSAGEPHWRRTGDGHGTTLVITDAGLAAIGVEPEGAPEEADTAPTGATEAPVADAAQETVSEVGPAPKARTPRAGTKQAMLIAMLRAPEGATIAEIVTATNWQSHTVRGAIAGALKKRLGLEVTSENVEERGRVYKLPAA
jgi:hypothetical protein